jgi:DNA repair protein RecN (Recombination protein N)
LLTSLSIKNYALIDDLFVDFSEGLTVVTGETGAGKSIILDAISLILGKRADLSSLKSSDQKCTIEAIFKLSSYALTNVFKENQIDYDPETILRREILPSGKSRAFVNDTPTTLDVMKKIGECVIDIHTQQQTQQLTSTQYHFLLLDSFADNTSVLKAYQSCLTEYKSLISEKDQLIAFQSQAQKEQSYHLFLLEELQAAKLSVGQQEEYEQRFESLQHAEDIKSGFAKGFQSLEDEQAGILSQIRTLKQALQGISKFSKAYQTLYDRVESTWIELEDISQEIQGLSVSIEDDPKQLENLQSKLQAIYSLQKKHHVASINELLEVQNDLEKRCSKTANAEAEINALTDKISIAHEKLKALAETLHQNRKKVAPALSKELEAILSHLGIKSAAFEFKISQTDTFYTHGSDQLDVLFSANKGVAFGPLKKVASGGELSRIMLAVKSIISKHTQLPTLIFDEIDTGVSGEISNAIANLMVEMSRERQIFAITHLPQIAAKGHHHFKVYKEEIEGKTSSHLKEMSRDERIVEIAQMLSGESVSESARLHAKQLLN